MLELLIVVAIFTVLNTITITTLIIENERHEKLLTDLEQAILTNLKNKDIHH